MAEDTSALIQNAGRLSTLNDDIVANIARGAQLGLGAHLPNLDAATPLVFNPVVPIVISQPTMFKDMAGYADTLKALIEKHAKSIEGIDLEYTMEFAETPAGHDGQQMSMPTNSKRSPVEPSFTFQEVYGNLVWNFIRNWLLLMKHPDTQASSVGAVLAADAVIAPQLLSSMAMDVLFIQFDTTLHYKNIQDAWIITGMMPKGTGPMGAKRTIGESTAPERTINFTGVVQHNANTKMLGRRIAEILSLHRINYGLATPVATQINSLLTNKGTQAEVSAALQNFQLLS